MDNFLAASEYIDFDADNIQALASELLSDGMSDIENPGLPSNSYATRYPIPSTAALQ